MSTPQFNVGDLVRRGRGKTVWAITAMGDRYIALLFPGSRWVAGVSA